MSRDRRVVVGSEELARGLDELLAAGTASIAAYREAENRVLDHRVQAAITRLRLDHERHVEELRELRRELLEDFAGEGRGGVGPGATGLPGPAEAAGTGAAGAAASGAAVPDTVYPVADAVVPDRGASGDPAGGATPGAGAMAGARSHGPAVAGELSRGGDADTGLGVARDGAGADDPVAAAVRRGEVSGEAVLAAVRAAEAELHRLYDAHAARGYMEPIRTALIRHRREEEAHLAFVHESESWGRMEQGGVESGLPAPRQPATGSGRAVRASPVDGAADGDAGEDDRLSDERLAGAG